VKSVRSGFLGSREINTVLFDPSTISDETMVEALVRAGTYLGTAAGSGGGKNERRTRP